MILIDTLTLRTWSVCLLVDGFPSALDICPKLLIPLVSAFTAPLTRLPVRFVVVVIRIGCFTVVRTVARVVTFTSAFVLAIASSRLWMRLEYSTFAIAVCNSDCRRGAARHEKWGSKCSSTMMDISVHLHIDSVIVLHTAPIEGRSFHSLDLVVFVCKKKNRLGHWHHTRHEH